MSEKSEKVLILGASPRPERYANKAMHRLIHHGHEPILVNEQYEEIEGKKVYPSISSVPEKADTLTMYIGPKLSRFHGYLAS